MRERELMEESNQSMGSFIVAAPPILPVCRERLPILQAFRGLSSAKRSIADTVYGAPAAELIEISKEEAVEVEAAYV